MSRRRTCHKCQRDTAVIGKKGKLARHNCEPTLQWNLEQADRAEVVFRRQLVDTRKNIATARAWTFRLAALAVANAVSDLLYVLINDVGVGFGIGLAGFLAALLGAFISSLRWHANAGRLDHHRVSHDRAVADLTRAQLAVDIAAIEADITASGVTPTDLDNPR